MSFLDSENPGKKALTDAKKAWNGTKWQDAENKVARILGLRLTTLSGAVFHDPGDSANYAGDDVKFPLIVDSKATQKKSYSLNRDLLNQYRERTLMHGKRFALHVEFQQEGQEDQDWVLTTLEDFAEILGAANHPVAPERTLSEGQIQALEWLEELAERIKDSSLRADLYDNIKVLKGDA